MLILVVQTKVSVYTSPRVEDYNSLRPGRMRKEKTTGGEPARRTNTLGEGIMR
jgi:hypothetical protein